MLYTYFTIMPYLLVYVASFHHNSLLYRQINTHIHTETDRRTHIHTEGTVLFTALVYSTSHDTLYFQILLAVPKLI